MSSIVTGRSRDQSDCVPKSGARGNPTSSREITCGWMSMVRVAISRSSQGSVPRDGRPVSFWIAEKLFDRHPPWRQLLLEGAVLERADRGQVGLKAIGQRVVADYLR